MNFPIVITLDLSAGKQRYPLHLVRNPSPVVANNQHQRLFTGSIGPYNPFLTPYPMLTPLPSFYYPYLYPWMHPYYAATAAWPLGNGCRGESKHYPTWKSLPHPYPIHYPSKLLLAKRPKTRHIGQTSMVSNQRRGNRIISDSLIRDDAYSNSETENSYEGGVSTTNGPSFPFNQFPYK